MRYCQASTSTFSAFFSSHQKWKERKSYRRDYGFCVGAQCSRYSTNCGPKKSQLFGDLPREIRDTVWSNALIMPRFIAAKASFAVFCYVELFDDSVDHQSRRVTRILGNSLPASRLSYTLVTNLESLPYGRTSIACIAFRIQGTTLPGWIGFEMITWMEWGFGFNRAEILFIHHIHVHHIWHASKVGHIKIKTTNIQSIAVGVISSSDSWDNCYVELICADAAQRGPNEPPAE